MIDYSILILSCDKYNSLWPSFVERLQKYWTHEANGTYLVTNHLEPHFHNITTLAIGDDIDWSSNLVKALSKIDTEYVYIMLEDVFLNTALDTECLDAVFECLETLKPNYLNTKALPLPRGRKFNLLVREVEKGSHYRASLCNAFWKKDILMQLINPGETPWQFEKRGSERSNDYDNFFGTTKNLLGYEHVIIGGKIARDVLSIADISNSKITRDFPTLSRYHWFAFKLSGYRNRTFSYIVPQSWQQKIRRYFE